MQPAIPSSFDPGQSQSAFQVARSGLRSAVSVPLYIYAVVVASLCIVWGLLWDIMWHMSIGRDGLFSAPHVLIYIGAVVAGVFSGYEILRLTFQKNHPDRAASVRFWGIFYGPLGSLYCVWGAIAMLTSAPFDDWWHNTYGLDVQILTPPHTVLALGMMMVQFGAMTAILASQNQGRTTSAPSRPSDSSANRLRWFFAITAGLLLSMLFVIFSESMAPYLARGSSYYVTAAIVFPVYLIAVGRGSLLRWPITTVAAIYMLALVIPSWIIQFFPATPRLGPVLNPITHYQPFFFPLLLVVPAAVLDYLLVRFGQLNDWALAAVLAVAFVVVFTVVQWPFAGFLHTSPYAQNHFFLSYSWTYGDPPDWKYRYAFHPRLTESIAPFLKGIGLALVYAYVSARIGLKWGRWMQRVLR